MKKFWFLFAIAGIATLVVLMLCLSLAGEAATYAALMAIELLALAICVAVLLGALKLHNQGRTGAGSLVLLIVDVPALLVLFGIILLMILFSHGGHH